jgi:hypothetical protein
MLNNQINASTPVLEMNGGKMVNFFTRGWFRFFDQVQTKIRILDGTNTTSANAGAATALPALPAGYMTIIDTTGVERKVPYYNP